MALGRYLLVNEVRRQWRSVAVLALLIGIVTVAVLTTAAGGRRTRSSFDGYLADFNGVDITALVRGEPVDPAAIAAIDGVETVIEFTIFAAFPDIEDTDAFFPLITPHDSRVPGTFIRSPLVSGRRADPGAWDEIALSERTARRLGVTVGSDLPLATVTPAGIEAFESSVGENLTFDGPPITIRVVGIVRSPTDIIGRETDLELNFLTPAFADRHREQLAVFTSGMLVNVSPGTPADSITGQLAALGLFADTEGSPATLRRSIDPTLGAMATALFLVAAAALIAGGTAVALAAARAADSASRDDSGLRALGISRAWLTARLASPGATAAVLGVVVGAALSVALSSTLPRGVARRALADEGIHVDAVVLGFGSLSLVVLFGALAVLVGAAAVRRAGREVAVHRPSKVAAAVAAGGLPVFAVAGLRFAFERVRGAGATPVRTAAFAAATAVAGVVAAVTVSASIDHATTTPSVYGSPWDAQLSSQGAGHIADGRVDVARLAGDPMFSATAEMFDAVELTVDDLAELGTVLDDRRGHTPFVMVRGREPIGDDEIGVAADTLDAISKDVGDTVSVAASGAATSREMVIVGVAVAPVPVDGGTNRRGVVLRRGAADTVGFTGECEGSDVECSRTFALTLASGRSLTEAKDAYAGEGTELTVEVPTAPADVDRLVAVAGVPTLLAALLALIGLAALIHVGLATVRHRSTDLAILRVLGFTSREMRGLIAIQLLALAATGAVAGVLVGTAVGSGVWTAIAARVTIPVVVERPVLVIVATAAAAALLALVLSVPAGRRAGRVAPAVELRAGSERGTAGR